MKLFRQTRYIGPSGLIVAVVGCSATAPGEAVKAEAPTECDGIDDEAATRDGNVTQEAEPNAPRALIGASLQRVCISDEQRSTVEAIGERVTVKEDAVATGRLALRAVLLDGLRKGQLDESSLVGKIDALVKAREDASPVIRKGLEDLHELLDAGQRTALTTAMLSRMNELARTSDGWLDTLATDLVLSGDQQQKIGALLAKSKPQLDEERAQIESATVQFGNRKFAIEAVSPVSSVGGRMRERAIGMVSIAKELTSILTPEQRDDLATRIEGAVGTPGTLSEQDANGGTPLATATGTLGQSRQALVAARRGGYRAGAVRGWGGRTVVVGGVAPASTTVVVVPTSGYVVGYPVTPGYGPGVW